MKFAILIIIFAIFIGLILRNHYYFGGFIETEESFNDQNCIKIKGPQGAEDIVIYKQFLIFSESNEVHLSIQAKDPKTIQSSLWSLKHGSNKLVRHEVQKPFHGHGMHIFENELYVVNHAFEEGDCIEVFLLSLKDQELIISYNRTLVCDLDKKYMLNDIVAYKQDQFYVTQFNQYPFPSEQGSSQYYKTEFYRIAGFKNTNLYTQNNSTSLRKLPISGVAFNGITINNQLIYISDIIARHLYVYNISSPIPTFVQIIDTPFFIDNLHYDSSTNKIYGGAFQKLHNNMRFGSYLSQGLEIPQQIKYGGVIEFDLQTQSFKWLLKTNLLWGISSAVKIGNTFYIGSFGDDGILICHLDKIF